MKKIYLRNKNYFNIKIENIYLFVVERNCISNLKYVIVSKKKNYLKMVMKWKIFEV